MNAKTTTAIAAVEPIRESAPSLVAKMASRYGIDAGKMLVTLKQTAFKGEVSNEQMMALLVVADQYQLNPWTRELFAFPSQQGIVPVVSVDGWTRIINSHNAFDGVEFEYGPGEPPEWIACSIHRKDRAHPTVVRERFSECKRETAPWKSHPSRMLRHKALIQCARLAFGFGGVYDEDEAARILEGERVISTSGTASVKERLGITTAGATVSETEEVFASGGAPSDTDNGTLTTTVDSQDQVLTFAEIATSINAAKDADALDASEATIDAAIADKTQRIELHDIAKARRIELA